MQEELLDKFRKILLGLRSTEASLWCDAEAQTQRISLKLCLAPLGVSWRSCSSGAAYWTCLQASVMTQIHFSS